MTDITSRTVLSAPDLDAAIEHARAALAALLRFPANGDGTGYHSQPNTRTMNYSMGPLIGYNFGPCSLMFIYNFPLKTENDVGGEWCNLRLVIPLGKLGL